MAPLGQVGRGGFPKQIGFRVADMQGLPVGKDTHLLGNCRRGVLTSCLIVAFLPLATGQDLVDDRSGEGDLVAVDPTAVSSQKIKKLVGALDCEGGLLQEQEGLVENDLHLTFIKQSGGRAYVEAHEYSLQIPTIHGSGRPAAAGMSAGKHRPSPSVFQGG